MNKKTIIIIVSIVCSLLLIGGGITGVVLLTGDKEPTSTKLDTMTVTLTENVASWETCENAEKYEISVNGALSYLENSVTSYTLKKGETFKIRAVGDGTNYLTSDWSNQVTYDTEETYTIIWKNGDTIIHVDSNVLEGTLPEYDGPTPTKPSINGISYKFKGWTPEVSIVTKDETYYALFEETLNTYTVTWKNDDTILEIDEFVEYGETPEYNGSTPTKEANETYTYTFIGWDKEISKVTSDVTYTAKFKEEKVLYKVSFYDEDGTTLLDEVYVGYGETASYSKTTPKKESADNEVYIFDKWVVEINSDIEASLSNIKQNIKVYASYTTELLYHNVTFYDYNKTAIKTEKVLHGNAATAPTEVEEIEGKIFKGWDALFNDVTTDLKVYPVYNNLYLVEFYDETGSLIYFYDIEEGMNLKTPDAPTKKGYKFIGWSPDLTSDYISNINSNLKYTAIFEKLHTVIFYDYDYSVIQEFTNVSKTDIIKVPVIGETSGFEKRIGYDFIGFDPELKDIELTGVEEDLEYVAQYKISTYEVKFVLPNGEILTQNVKHGYSAVAPNVSYEEVFFNWKTYCGYKFIGWDKEYKNVTQDLVVNSLLTNIQEPVIAIETVNINKNVNQATVAVYISCNANFTMSGLDFVINYNNKLDVSTKDNGSYLIDINKNIITNDTGNGVGTNVFTTNVDSEKCTISFSCIKTSNIIFTSENHHYKLIEISFDTKGLEAGFYQLSFADDNYVIVDTGDNVYNQISPVCIFGGINIISEED